MEFLVLLVSALTFVATLFLEHRLTVRREATWLDRIGYEFRPFAVGLVFVVLGLLAYLLPPHLESPLGVGGLALLLCSWMSERRQQKPGPPERGYRGVLHRLAHPRG